MNINDNFSDLTFDLPKNKSNVIKVIGVGGGGSNAINHMFLQGIKGVDFVICNTDAQALENSGVPNKIQLGVNLTEGLGAGANPDVGEQAAIESEEDIKLLLEPQTKMVFVTAGMGGGTGTGAAPVIAKMAKEMDILTVGIVTTPFQFEGKLRNEQAKAGIEKLRQQVDSLIVINNNKLRDVYGNLGFKAGFSKADEVLATASKGIAEVITHHYTQNIDLRDAKTVLSNSGSAIMGSATSAGNSRAKDAVTKALDSPLLNDNKITGAKNVLLLIVSGSHEITIDEIGEINEYIQSEAGYNANIIMGVGEDEALEEAVSVTVIATGFDVDQQFELTNTEVKKVVHSLDTMDVKRVELSSEVKRSINIEATTLNEEVVLEDTLVVEDTNSVETISQESSYVVQELNVGIEDVEIKDVTETNFNPLDMDLVPSSELIKDIDVVIEEVLDCNISTQDTVKNELPVEEDTPDLFSQDNQAPLTFDFPITNKKEIDDLKEPDSVIENPSISSEGKVIFTLEDDEVKEKKIDNTLMNKVKEMEPSISEEVKPVSEIEISEPKIVEVKTESPSRDLTKDRNDPYDTPIDSVLKARTEERKKSLKDYNHKFSSHIDDLEKQPAYKRKGLDLDFSNQSSKINSSRISLSLDDNDDLQLRSNNSFLHDNVD